MTTPEIAHLLLLIITGLLACLVGNTMAITLAEARGVHIMFGLQFGLFKLTYDSLEGFKFTKERLF